MIIAVIAGPILAIQVQRWLDELKHRRMRREAIFYTLMATRAARASLPHVEALNRIDLEFSSRRSWGRVTKSEVEASVTAAWNSYRDSLNSPPDGGDYNAWSRRRDELFTELLFQLSKCLKYEFDKVQLEKGVYSPKAHGDDLLFQQLTREWSRNLIDGKAAIPIKVVQDVGGRDLEDKSDN